MAKQYKLDGMPEKPELLKVAADFLECKDQIENIKTKQERIKPVLIAAFKKADVESVKVNGRLVSFADVERISVKNVAS